MATVNPTVKKQGENAVLFTWTPLTSANLDGAPIGPEWTDYCDRSIHVSASNFDGATLTWQGSNIEAASSYVSLTDPQGNAIAKTVEALEQIVENTLWARPLVSGAGASTSITVSVLARRNILSRS